MTANREKESEEKWNKIIITLNVQTKYRVLYEKGIGRSKQKNKKNGEART